MNAGEIRTALGDVSYQDWTFHVGIMDDGYYLQVRFNADCENWSGRKWYLSSHAVHSEVIQTALKAVLTAVEHEAREKFLYRGEAIFGPHHNVDALLGIAQQKREALGGVS